MNVELGELLEGPAGTAQEVICSPPFDRPGQVATVAAWFLRCPGQTPAWDRFNLGVIHLRPIDGAPPALVRVPGATHEVLLLALDPRADAQPTDPESWQHLRPVNLCEQVELPGDVEAKTLARSAARAVVDGVLWAEPPLSGQVEPWRTSLIKSAAHLRGEEHAP